MSEDGHQQLQDAQEAMHKDAAVVMFLGQAVQAEDQAAHFGYQPLMHSPHQPETRLGMDLKQAQLKAQRSEERATALMKAHADIESLKPPKPIRVERPT